VLVTLTDKGRALRAPLIAEAEAVNSQASEDFSAAESARFLALLRRMAANLDRDE
jgi:DNA-binding MarR family transcriptional regulator